MKTIIITLAVIISVTAIKTQAATPNVDDVLAGISVGVAPTREGLPSQPGQADGNELLIMREPTIQQIKDALTESKKLAVGSRIDFFTNAATTIITDSGARPTEAAARMTLNRVVQVVNDSIATSGFNSEMLASWYANLLEKSFVLSAAFVNNPACVTTVHNKGVSQVEDCLQKLPLAKVGYDVTQLLWRSRASLVSNTAKAVLMIRILQFMEYDFNNDPRRSTDGFVFIYKKIVKIQTQNQNYKNVVLSLAAGQEPDARDLSALSVAMDNVYTAIPAILNK